MTFVGFYNILFNYRHLFYIQLSFKFSDKKNGRIPLKGKKFTGVKRLLVVNIMSWLIWEMMFAIFETNVATCLFETLVNATALKLLKRNKSADKIYYMREVCWNEKHRFLRARQNKTNLIGDFITIFQPEFTWHLVDCWKVLVLIINFTTD